MTTDRSAETSQSRHPGPSLKSVQPARSIPQALAALVLAITVAIYATLGQTVFAGFWLEVALLSLVSIAILPWFIKAPERWLFAVLVVSLSFSARLRLFSSEMHQGGAEAAIAPLDFPLLALACLYFLDGLKNGTIEWHWGPVETRIVIFGVMTSFSLLVAPSVAFGVYELLRLVKVLLLLVCIKRFVRTESLAKLTVYLMIGIVLAQSLLGIAQLTLNRPLGLFILGEADQVWLDFSVGEGARRVGGTLGHANNLALFLELLLPLCFSLFISVSVSSTVRSLAFLAFSTGIVAMILTLSRSGWVSLALALGLVLFIRFRSHRLLAKRRVSALLVTGLVSLAVILLLWDTIYLRLTASSPNSFIFRQHMMLIATNMLKAHPIIGTGLNNFMLNTPQYTPIGIPHYKLPVHNIYLLVAAEVGLLGFLAFAWLVVTTLRVAWRAVKLSHGIHAASSRGLFAGMVATFLVDSMLGWGWRFDVNYMLFWFIVGFLLSLINISRKSRVSVTA